MYGLGRHGTTPNSSLSTIPMSVRVTAFDRPLAIPNGSARDGRKGTPKLQTKTQLPSSGDSLEIQLGKSATGHHPHPLNH